MDNFYFSLKKLAKSIKSQNLFSSVKEINSIRLFKNTYDLSKIQFTYLSYLYIYDSINRDIIIDKISKHVLDSEIIEEAYLLWKSKNKGKTDFSDKKPSDLHMVVGTTINFPKEVKQDA